MQTKNADSVATASSALADAVSIEVRVASRDDHQVVVDLINLHQEHRSGSRGADSYLAFLESNDVLEFLQHEGPPWVVLAFANADPVGIATLEIRVGGEIRHATLRCLFGTLRDGQYRAEELLLTRAEEIAAEHGCNAIDIEVLPGDQQTKSLLEASGYKARLLTMHRALKKNG